MAAAYDVGALVAYLLGESDVAALVGTRVFGNSLPDSQAALMPRKCVVVTSAGAAIFSMAARSEVPVDRRLKDVRCYAETRYEAERLFGVVNAACKRLRRRLVTPLGGLPAVLLYSAVKVGGPTTRLEPEVEWPMCFASYSLFAADEAA